LSPDPSPQHSRLLSHHSKGRRTWRPGIVTVGGKLPVHRTSPLRRSPLEDPLGSHRGQARTIAVFRINHSQERATVHAPRPPHPLAVHLSPVPRAPRTQPPVSTPSLSRPVSVSRSRYSRSPPSPTHLPQNPSRRTPRPKPLPGSADRHPPVLVFVGGRHGCTGRRLSKTPSSRSNPA
jgi:hypothetical protein